MKKLRVISLPIFISLLLFSFGSLCISVQKVYAEVTTPLYTVDYKPQVLFGDTVPVDPYYGLENYAADYVGGYLHITYTTTHAMCCYASYPPQLFVWSVDPSVVPNFGSNLLYIGPVRNINSSPGSPTDFYFIDIQFSPSGYREVMMRGPGHTPFSDDTVAIPDMDDDTFIALANQLPLQDPPSQYSMSFKPMRLVSVPPTKILSFDISTSTKSVTVHDYIRPIDVGGAIDFTLSTSTGGIIQGQVFTNTIHATTTGDLYYTWTYPTLAETLTGFAEYTFSTSIAAGTTTIKSKTVTMTVATPIVGYPGYGNFGTDTSEQISSSYNHLIQTMGTGLSGTLTRIDIETNHSNALYYGSMPVLTLMECDDDTYGNNFSGQGCSSLYADHSTDISRIVPGIQSFYTDPVVFNPAKYYFFRTQGNNQFNALPAHYGSSADTVDGACYQYRLGSVSGIFPCATVADLYFRLYGITKSVTPPPLTGNSNVLFLPGLEASRLYKPSPINGSTENRLWEPGGEADVENLYLNAQGKSIDTNIYTRDVLDEAYVSLAGPNIYKSFLTTLERMKSTDHSIADYSAVPYDWRLSIDDILNGGTKTGAGNLAQISYLATSSDPYILSELRRLAASSKSGKVTIVAHSNGGLVAKALLKRLADSGDPLLSKVDKLILVAVPQLGTPAAIAAELHGINQSIPTESFPLFLSNRTARGLGENSPAAYNLLPSANYFTYVDTPPVKFDSTLPDWITKYGDIIHSQERLHNFLIDSYGRVSATSTNTQTPDMLNAGLLSQSEVFHAALDNWTPPAGIDVIEIAGWGVPTTISGITYTKEKGVIKPMPAWTIDGDGTVVTPSALWANGASTTRYWVDMKKYNNDHWIINGLGVLPFNHKNILEVIDLDEFIKDFILGNTKILNNYTYLSTSTPPSTNTRLRYALHSPLTLNLYDNEGHHTGISTTTGQIEEQIPGTYYTQFGDSKYIFSDTPNVAHIIMNGYAPGTFTFNIDELQGDTRIASTTFKDIPTATSTIVTLDVQTNITTVSPMRIDTDGNGSIDFNLVPKLNGTVTLPAIYRFDGFLQPINDTAHQIGQNLSVFKAGSTVPVKFQLKKSDGTIIQAPALPVWLAPQKGSAMAASVDESVYSDPATSGNVFKWDPSSQQYIYNWSTKGLASGYWYRISVKLDDGNIYTVTVGLK